MHPAIAALLDLHQVAVQRQRLFQVGATREGKLKQADQVIAQAVAAAEAAQKEVESQGALTRQYTSDVERCDATVNELRGKQMEAKTNKEYLEIINGIESAKAEKKLREESLSNLAGQIDDLEAKAKAAQERVTALEEAKLKLETELEATAGSGESKEELERIYQDKRQHVDASFLEVYERLIAANHKMPLIPVDPASRATPLGKVVSHNDCEKVRMGQLVVDSATNGILYLNEQ